MKKYLLITQYCPFPPHKNGGVHTIYNILCNLPNDVEMDIIYYYEKDENAEKQVRRIKNIKNVNHCLMYHYPSLKYRLLNFINHIPDYFSEVDIKGFCKNVNFSEYDVVILDQIFSLPLANYISKDVPIIAMMHDNNGMLYQRKAEQEKNFLKKFYDLKQCQYFKELEEKYFTRIKKVIYVSELDAKLAKETHLNSKTIFENITLGVDLPDSNQISSCETDSLVFSGVMDYGPNEDAAIYFATEVLPKIRESIPNVKFVIAGKNPTNRIKELESQFVSVTGFVDDMYKTITKSEIYISPLRYGSGTKNKVLEAMAAGLPVFATEVSREGIVGLKDGINCFFIDNTNMVDVITKAIKDKKKLEYVSQNGKEYVEKNHSWKHVFDKFLLD